jgi:hypothetical protein
MGVWHTFFEFELAGSGCGSPLVRETVITSNGKASETKAKESFDNGFFFDIEAKRTPSIVSKLFSKRSEHIR